MTHFNYVVAIERTLCKWQLLSSVCIHFFLVKFADAEFRFLLFPFQIQNLFSAYVVLGGNLY